MNINGTNGLACLTKVERDPSKASRYPSHSTSSSHLIYQDVLMHLLHVAATLIIKPQTNIHHTRDSPYLHVKETHGNKDTGIDSHKFAAGLLPCHICLW